MKPDFETKIQDVVAAYQIEKGPMGIGVDVRWSIARWRSDRQGLLIDAGRWNEMMRQQRSSIEKASNTLWQDGDSQKVFKWNGLAMKFSDKGVPKSDSDKLNRWLCNQAKRIVDASGHPIRNEEVSRKT